MARRIAKPLRASLLAAAMLLGCGSSLRTVPTGPHPSTGGGERIIVDYPPPPAQLDRIESDPGSPCRWQDGHWIWQGRRWSWQAGSWVVPPQNCYYAPAVMVWVPSLDKGELYYMPPRWYPNDAEQLTEKELLERCQSVKPCGRTPATDEPETTP
jgi:hypothetical protein